MIAADIMTKNVVTVTPDTTVVEIARILLEKRISAVPVIENGRPVGIVSEGDLLRQAEPGAPRQPKWLELFFSRDTLAAEYIHSHARTASQIMTREVVSVMEDTAVSDIVDLLEGKRIKRVPVVDIGGHVVGIVSRSNLLQALVARAQPPRRSDGDEDTRIRNAYLAEIRAQAWAELPDEGNVIVDKAVVHLWGAVRSPEVRKAMTVAALNIQGVKGVEDHMGERLVADAMTWTSWPMPPPG
ncbi:MAG: CBS domain-containing protein [Alphaproteobacteria bacterium]|nr:CBS domain-containing protein [Alphaproteobacteria bacterium]